MKLKLYFKNLVLYNILLIIIISLFYRIGIIDKVIRYIKFETIVIKFQDLLSIAITILTVFVGAVITVATVLISMCDKRIIKLIQNYNKSSYLVSCIKIAITTGISIIILLAVVYARLDLNIYIVRLIILYLSGYLMVVFITKSRLLIQVVLSVLNDAFKEPNHFIVEGPFKKPENKTTKNN